MKMTLVTICILFFLLMWCACVDNNSFMQTPVVKSVLINGESIHYIDAGKGDPVIFVHGTLGDYRTWRELIIPFSKKYRVISYSRRYAYPNKQVIDDSADYTVAPHVKDLAAFIEALELEPVHLVGHSYGAFTALLTTLNHPELVRSLTLGEPPIASLLLDVPGGDEMLNNFVTGVIIPTGEAFKNNDSKKAIASFYNGAWGKNANFSLLPKSCRDIMMDNTLELRGAMLTPNLFPPVACDDLKRINVPVLLLKGEFSPVFTTSIINMMDRCMTNKETVTLRDSSHGLVVDNPVDFNKTVLGFLDRLE